MKQFDTYIFDLDGTLLYTLDDLTASTNHAMRAYGMAEHTTALLRATEEDDRRRETRNGIM